MGTPIGIHILTYLMVYGTVVWQRRFLAGKSFTVIWVGFALAAAAAAVVSWLLISLYYVVFIPPEALAYQYLLSLGAFPLLSWFFMRWQLSFLAEI